jgi:hypothetical protein
MVLLRSCTHVDLSPMHVPSVPSVPYVCSEVAHMWTFHRHRYISTVLTPGTHIYTYNLGGGGGARHIPFGGRLCHVHFLPCYWVFELQL